MANAKPIVDLDKMGQDVAEPAPAPDMTPPPPAAESEHAEVITMCGIEMVRENF